MASGRAGAQGLKGDEVGVISPYAAQAGEREPLSHLRNAEELQGTQLV